MAVTLNPNIIFYNSFFLVNRELFLNDSPFLRSFWLYQSKIANRRLFLTLVLHHIAKAADLKQFKKVYSSSFKILRTGTFIVFPFGSFLAERVFEILVKEEKVQQGIMAYCYSIWEELSVPTKYALSTAAAGTATYLIYLGIGSILFRPVYGGRGGLGALALVKPVTNIIGPGLEPIILSPEICDLVTKYTLDQIKDLVNNNSTVVQTVRDVLVNNTIEYLNKLLLAKKDISFLNVHSLYAMLSRSDLAFPDL